MKNSLYALALLQTLSCVPFIKGHTDIQETYTVIFDDSFSANFGYFKLNHLSKRLRNQEGNIWEARSNGRLNTDEARGLYKILLDASEGTDVKIPRGLLEKVQDNTMDGFMVFGPS